MGARILVIEDNPANLELMSYLLRAFGHHVLTTSDGEAGLEAVRSQSFDLIVCDVQIPKINGLEVARRLKSHASFCKIPLVAVTAFAMVGDRDKMLAAGFDGYIPKPIVPEQFAQQIEGFLVNHELAPPTPPALMTPDASRRGQPRATILVVDDSYVNAELARSMLEPIGYEVVVAGGVGEAIDLFKKIDPDLILSDVHMREASGFDLLRSLKADLVLRRIPFVFISSTVWQEEDRTRGLAMGAKQFILRPVDSAVVIAEIERCLREGRSAGHGDDTGSR
jgi:CheY-like chemotaxis protein